MAFDGPGPFDGDPVFNYLHSVSNQPPAAVQAALASAFQEVLQGGAARHMPAEFATMLGIDLPSETQVYIEVDEGVWAWACAEMVAVALGHEPDSPVPEPFFGAAKSLPHPRHLAADAVEVLDIIVDTKRSELASLLNDSDEFRARIGVLRNNLKQSASTPN